mmetsp:Transcript_8383/g.26773  ORF Transcript_8383/g.26773 Transcript_8383/m.26773 type:complete len:83 (+) Transcript_8383:571-819(+)
MAGAADRAKARGYSTHLSTEALTVRRKKVPKQTSTKQTRARASEAQAGACCLFLLVAEFVNIGKFIDGHAIDGVVIGANGEG